MMYVPEIMFKIFRFFLSASEELYIFVWFPLFGLLIFYRNSKEN
jgi:hypothetical protein